FTPTLPQPPLRKTAKRLTLHTPPSIHECCAFPHVLSLARRDPPVAPEEPRSVSQWIEALRQGDEDAPTRLWERYFQPLVEVARTRMKHRRLPDDGEDAALSAFKSLFAGLAHGDLDQ